MSVSLSASPSFLGFSLPKLQVARAIPGIASTAAKYATLYGLGAIGLADLLANGSSFAASGTATGLIQDLFLITPPLVANVNSAAARDVSKSLLWKKIHEQVLTDAEQAVNRAAEKSASVRDAVTLYDPEAMTRYNGKMAADKRNTLIWGALATVGGVALTYSYLQQFGDSAATFLQQFAGF